MTRPFIRIVVLNFNGAPFIYRCLEAILALEYPADRREVVVVDNASVDGSVDEVRRRFSDVAVIENASNTGFPANNLAMVDRRGVDYIALVNNDAFVEPDWLARLVEAASNDASVGAWCPKILLEPRFHDMVIEAEAVHASSDPRLLGVQVSGVRVDGIDRFGDSGFGEGFWGPEAGGGDLARFQWTSDRAVLSVPARRDGAAGEVEIRCSARHGSTVRIDGGDPFPVSEDPRWIPAGQPGGEPHDIVNNVGSRLVDGGFGGDRGFLVCDEGQFDEPRDVFAWCGGGVLLRTDYLDDVGLFDERFFLYYEDTDLSWRGLARGWRYRTVPDAVMRHLHSATSEEGSPLFQHFVERNRLAMLTKNAPLWLLREALVTYLRALTSFTLRDIIQPVLRGSRPDPGLPVRRAKTLLAWVKMLPALWPDRRRLRRQQLVPDAAVTGWSEPQ